MDLLLSLLECLLCLLWILLSLLHHLWVLRGLLYLLLKAGNLLFGAFRDLVYQLLDVGIRWDLHLGHGQKLVLGIMLSHDFRGNAADITGYPNHFLLLVTDADRSSLNLERLRTLCLVRISRATKNVRNADNLVDVVDHFVTKRNKPLNGVCDEIDRKPFDLW